MLTPAVVFNTSAVAVALHLNFSIIRDVTNAVASWGLTLSAFVVYLNAFKHQKCAAYSVVTFAQTMALVLPLSSNKDLNTHFTR